MSMRVVFMGSPDFALPSLSALAKVYDVVGVITQPDRASGRGRELKAPPVKTLALESNIPVMQPEKLRDPNAMAQLRGWNPDLIVVAAFGQILRRDVLDLPRYGCINVHASLLPRWRGAAPINAAILAGDERIGVTIMKMDEGLDTGPMLAQKSLRVEPGIDTTADFLEVLSYAGADLLMEALSNWIAGNIMPQPQDDKLATYAPILKKEDGLLDFCHPAVELERRVRAMKPWPGTWFEWKGNLLKVLRAFVVSGDNTLASGTRFAVDGKPSVQSADGALVLEEVQPAGRKVMSGKSFLAGTRDWFS